MKVKTDFEIEISTGRLKLGVKEKCTITYKMLADLIGWEGSHKNLATAVRTGKIGIKWIPKLCEVLPLNESKLYKLKNESSQ